MNTSNFWADDYPRPADLPSSELPEKVDVAVVGGGYTGLHAALALRKAGADVAVLEQETIGWGASSRNGGMALTGMKMEMPLVFKRYGARVGAPLLGRGRWRPSITWRGRWRRSRLTAILNERPCPAGGQAQALCGHGPRTGVDAQRAGL